MSQTPRHGATAVLETETLRKDAAPFRGAPEVANSLLSSNGHHHQEATMHSILRGFLLSVAVLLPVSVFAQQPSPPKDDGATLELKRKGPPVIAPAPQSPEAIGEAERAAKELERTQRQDDLLHEATPAPPRRPDLDYDVKSGIQQKAIEKALPLKTK